MKAMDKKIIDVYIKKERETYKNNFPKNACAFTPLPFKKSLPHPSYFKYLLLTISNSMRVLQD